MNGGTFNQLFSPALQFLSVQHRCHTPHVEDPGHAKDGCLIPVKGQWVRVIKGGDSDMKIVG